LEALIVVEYPNQLTTVVIPEFVPERLIARVMHNQTAARLPWLLRGYKDIVIIEVPFQINSPV
jgi:hypothetical protein